MLNESKEGLKFIFMEAFMYRCHPLTHKMLEIVKQEYSNKKFLSSHLLGLLLMSLMTNIGKNPDLGGGSIMDIGCYPMSMARLIGKFNGKFFFRSLVYLSFGRAIFK